MKKQLLLSIVLLLASSAFAVSGCNNLTLATGWTCIDSNAISGAGTNNTTLSLVHNAGVQTGDIILGWANLVMVSGSWSGPAGCLGAGTCTQYLTFADNSGCGNTFTTWSKGWNSYSNPANLWVGQVYYGIAGCNKATGYQLTCSSVPSNGTVHCDDLSVIIIRPPTPATTLTEDTTPQYYGALANGFNSGPGPCPCPTTPSGLTTTTTHASLVIGGGNTDSAPDQVDAPFVGLDGDGVFTGPMYYLMGAVQTSPGSITGKWYISGTGNTALGSVFLALSVNTSSTPNSVVPSPMFAMDDVRRLVPRWNLQ